MQLLKSIALKMQVLFSALLFIQCGSWMPWTEGDQEDGQDEVVEHPNSPEVYGSNSFKKTELKGKITDTHGNPLKDAKVYFLGFQTEHAISDSFGNYVVAVPKHSGETSYIVASYTTIPENGEEVSLGKKVLINRPNSIQKFDINLEPSGALSGSISIPNEVSDSSIVEVYIPGTDFSTFTESDGSFTFKDIPAGTWQLSIKWNNLDHTDKTAFKVNSGESIEIPEIVLPLSKKQSIE